MGLLPIFLKVAGRPVLVVGAGNLALPKIATLLELGAQICVVAPQARAEIRKWASEGRIQWQQRPYEQRDVDGNLLVYSATGKPEVDRSVSQQARLRGVPCNAIDDPSYCDFYSPAVVQRGDLQIAISTNGQSPALAQQIRQQLEERFDPSWASRVAELGQRRRDRMALIPAGDERNRVLHQLASDQLNVEKPSTLWQRTQNFLMHWRKSKDDQVWLT